MFYKLYSIIFSFVLFIISSPAFALSCMAPQIDRTVIDEASVIFEGHVVKKSQPNIQERLERLSEPLDDSYISIYEFQVSHGWKGVQKGDIVRVSCNSRHGKCYIEEDTEYLLVFSDDRGQPYNQGPCDLSWITSHSDKKLGDAEVQLDVLRNILGSGHHIKVQKSQQACQSDDQCTSVGTHCGACDCGTAINKSYVDQHNKEFEQICLEITINELCEMACTPSYPECSEGFCTLD